MMLYSTAMVCRGDGGDAHQSGSVNAIPVIVGIYSNITIRNIVFTRCKNCIQALLANLEVIDCTFNTTISPLVNGTTV